MASASAAKGLSRPVSILYVLAMATIFGTMVMMCFLTLNLVWPKVILTVNVSPIRVLTPKVVAGEAVRLSLDYCKAEERHSLAGLTLARQGQLITFPAVMSSLPQGCHVIQLVYHVPAWVQPGNYKAYITREYRPTVFKESGVMIESEPFQVLPPRQTFEPDEVGPIIDRSPKDPDPKHPLK